MSTQTRFVKPQMDGVTADVTVTKITGNIEHLYRPTRSGFLGTFLVIAPLVKVVSERKHDDDNGDYVQRTQTFSVSADEGSGYLITKEVLDTLTEHVRDGGELTFEVLRDACGQQAQQDRADLEDVDLVPGVVHASFGAK